MADGRRLQLGPVLPEARQGRDERHLEDRLLLRQPEGRLHEARAVRPGRLRGDEGADRRRRRPRSRAARSTSSAARSTTRAASCASRRAQTLSVDAAVLDRTGSSRASTGARRASAPDVGARTTGDEPDATARPSSSAGRAVAAPRDHEAVPRRRRERRRRLRGGRGRGARAARRERRRQVTLSNILTGLYRPDEGEIAPLRRARSSSTRRATRSTPGSAWCTSTSGSSRRSPSPRTSSSATTAARARSSSSTRAHIERRVAELGERYRIAVDPRARIWQLSLGEQQRVEILKALYREARILILDEPTAVLTPQEADSLFETLRDDGRRGPHGDLHLAQAARGEGGLRPRHRAARRARPSRRSSTADATPHSLAALMVGRDVDASERVRARLRAGRAGARARRTSRPPATAATTRCAASRSTSAPARSSRSPASPATGSASSPRPSPACGRATPARVRRRREAARAAATRARRSAPASRTSPRTASTPASRRGSRSRRTSCSSPTATASSRPGRCCGSARSASARPR